MAYAEVSDIQARMTRTMTADEAVVCESLLEDAAIIIDSYSVDASIDVKQLVSVKMVSRAISDGSSGVPMGATQGSMSALGYSQSWTIGSNGSTGELYLSKLEKKLLGVGNKIGSRSPLEPMEEQVNP